MNQNQTVTTTPALFNAAAALGNWDPAAERAFDYLNVFEDGNEYDFYATAETKEWTRGVVSPMVALDMEGARKAHSHYVGSCMVIEDIDALLLNQDKDPIFHCAHTPRTARQAGLQNAYCLMDYVDQTQRDGAFPRVKAVMTLPTAVAVADLKNASDETKNAYAAFFNMKWEDIIKDTEFLPSVKTAKAGRNVGKQFQTKRTLVKVTDANLKPVKKSIVAAATETPEPSNN